MEFAREFEAAGAAAIELNLYRVPTDPAVSGEALERCWLETVRSVRTAVSLPLAVKLVPWLSSPGNFSARLVEAGVDGLRVVRPLPSSQHRPGYLAAETRS